MAVSDFLTPKMIIIGSSLISLIAMTPLCGGESYDFYESAEKAGVTGEEASAALNSTVEAYQKEVPDYALKDKPLYASTKNPREFLMLLHPYIGTCAPNCVPALIRRLPDGGAQYVKDMEKLNCRMLLNKDALVICDHSSGFF